MGLKDNTWNDNSTGNGRWPANLIHDGSDEVVGMFPNTKSGNLLPHHKTGTNNGVNIKQAPKEYTREWGGDSGSAARFFYSAKVSKRERDAGLEGFEEKKTELNSGGIGREISVAKRLADGDGINAPKARNFHPTLKPISLTTYLAKLILPPKLDQPRRLLVPFAGSGSEVIGGYKAGWDEVVGVEREKEYCEIARARIAHWTKEPTQDGLL